MEVYGYAGKVLRLDLSSGSIQTEDLDMDMAKKYLGGQGTNTKLAYDMIKPGVDPLGPENVVLLGAGPLCGTPAASATKVMMTTKSAINGSIGTAGGCGFAPMLKWAGYDGIVITGSSPKPVYLLILDDEIKLCDASGIWGRDIFESTDILREKHGKDASVICIGQASENLCRISLAFIDKIAHLGRGFGAVLGSKKLKAIVVRGTKGIKIADVDMFYKMFDSLMSRARGDRGRPRWIKYGLEAVVEPWFDNGLILVNNRRKVPDEKEMKAKFGMKAWDEVLELHPWAGPSCITCDKVVAKIKKGEFKGLETTASFTPALGTAFGPSFNMSLNRAVKCHDMFQRYGLDELDGAYLMDLVVDLYNNGLISKEDLGMEPKYNFETVVEATEKIVKREGFWGIVADGIPAVLEKVPGADEYAISQKGLIEYFDGRMILGVETFADAMLNPRGGQTLALVRSPSTAMPGIARAAVEGVIASSYYIPAGARRRIFPAEEKETWNVPRLARYVQDINTGYNCLGVCYRFIIGRIWNPVIAGAVYYAVTGTAMSAEEFMRISERVFNLQKAANIREGFDRKDDGFPKRWLTEPVKWGEKEIYLQDYTRTRYIDEKGAKAMLDDYYDERGWDLKRGIPTKGKLVQLGLPDVAADLEKRGVLEVQ